MGLFDGLADMLGFGGGTNKFAEQQVREQKAEQARKDALRYEINSLFESGLPPPTGYAPTTTGTMENVPANSRDIIGISSPFMVAPTNPSGAVPISPQPIPPPPQATYAPGKTPEELFRAQESELQNALRGNYGADLGDKFTDASRTLKFNAANTGQIGGSAYADSAAKLSRENSLGGTRIADAVQRAVNGLRAERERTRGNALSLVNSGAGREAVSAAQSGIQSAISQARAQQQERLFDDLFSGLALGMEGRNAADERAKLAALYQSKTGSFFPQSATNSPTIR